MPEISRVVVPLLPQSKVSFGACSPWRPFPWTKILSPASSIRTPMLRKQPIVERQSAPLRKPVISVVPLAMEPNMMLRWEMDLSPGMTISPLRGARLQ